MSPRPADRRTVAVSSAGMALVVLPQPDGAGLPEVLHWGAAIEGGDAVYDALAAVTFPPLPPSAPDEPTPFTLLPGEADGWAGTPGWSGHRGGGGGAVRWLGVTCEAREGVIVTRAHTAEGLDLSLRHALDAYGVLRVEASVTNSGAAEEPWDVAGLRAMLPLPPRAAEVLDLTGRWCRERSPQRRRLEHGSHVRASRRGRTGHDATLLLAAGTAGFDWRSGEVWAVHTAWSGNHESLVEALPEGAGRHHAVLGGGELLAPGEIRLAPGDTYRAPTIVFVHSDEGLDGLSARLHRSLRARPGHPAGARPVVLSTWEAVYFDTDLERLLGLADLAARIGVERFVLDDGWFGGRRHDAVGLGDWVVSRDVWPEGLHALVDRVKGNGLQFGLWFEPEMVNPDSQLARVHPEWILGPVAGHPRSWRSQQALDLAQDDVREYLLEAISGLVTTYGIDSIKWDHNRDLLEAVHTAHRAGHPVADAPATHAQTVAFYRLLDELRERHPALEVESCSSGGARVDLAVLERTDRIWASDCNDPLERAGIQRWTSLLVPPELIGTHVGPPVAHTTQRATDLGFRTLMALQGHAGLEWDITTCTEDELRALTAWTALVRELRPLLHTGSLVRSETADGTVHLTGTVDAHRRRAVYTIARLVTGPDALGGALPLPGLDPTRSYRVRVRPEAGLPEQAPGRQPPWWSTAQAPVGLVVPGSVLTSVGLALPLLGPAQGYLLEVHVV